MKDGKHVFWLHRISGSYTDKDGVKRPQMHPVTCVAMNLEGKTVKYALATHNPHDKFKRSVGYQKASGRLLSKVNPPVTLVLAEDSDPKLVVLESIAHDPYNGPLTKEAAEMAIWDHNAKKQIATMNQKTA